jgi:protein SCO1
VSSGRFLNLEPIAPGDRLGAGRRGRLAAVALAMLAAAPGVLRAANDWDNATATRRRVEPDPDRLPPAGSYALAHIFTAPDGFVLGSEGRAHRLHSVLAGRLTILSFIYSYCRDPIGCPLAWQILDRVHAELRRDHRLARRAQLVSLSFDPTHDTPMQMKALGGPRVHDQTVRWLFLTTASVPRLLPLLEGFGQDVTVEVDARGRPTRTLNHLLKLFLIDADRVVREIYSVATLAPEAVLNDLRTLQLEAAAQSVSAFGRWR